ncbi:transposase [Methylicorpusculum oleiharenae]|uniref:transposase n=1 Tax=Methylicorpusculum oleiharenae TaxID=1338687 RepID=UPI0019D19713
MAHKTRIKRYPTDLDDRKWKLVQDLFPATLPDCRPRQVNLRKIVNAILYIALSGCVLRLQPPPMTSRPIKQYTDIAGAGLKTERGNVFTTR